MHHAFYLLIPLAVAAGRSLAIGIGPSNVQRSATSVEMEYRVLAYIAGMLTMLLVGSSLIRTYPEFGALIAQYNQF